MNLVASMAFAATTALFAFLGLRLLWLCRETRQVPEFVLGIAAAAAAAGGGLVVWLQADVDASETMQDVLGLAALLFWAVSATAFYVGAWRIFQPSQLWGALATVAGSIAIAMSCVIQVFQDMGVASVNAGTVLLEIVALGGGFGWLAVESFVYYIRMRKQMRIGLNDSLMASQFFCWGLASASSAVSVVLAAGTTFLAGREFLDIPEAKLGMSLLDLASIVFFYTAFFPLHSYQRWLGVEGSDFQS